MSKTLNIGIASYAEIKARTLRIARGELKPRAGDPKVWFPSLESLAKVLSESNRELLALIDARNPRSLQELSDASGRATSNLSRTLKTMSRYGLVVLEEHPGRRLAPKVLYSRFKLEMPIGLDGASNTAKRRNRTVAHAG
jgi:predicted transcriptional regulator